MHFAPDPILPLMRPCAVFLTRESALAFASALAAQGEHHVETVDSLRRFARRQDSLSCTAAWLRLAALPAATKLALEDGFKRWRQQNPIVEVDPNER